MSHQNIVQQVVNMGSVAVPKPTGAEQPKLKRESPCCPYLSAHPLCY
jgi:hypothetical protein